MTDVAHDADLQGLYDDFESAHLIPPGKAAIPAVAAAGPSQAPPAMRRCQPVAGYLRGEFASAPETHGDRAPTLG